MKKFTLVIFWHLQREAQHRDHFVRRLCLSVSLCICWHHMCCVDHWLKNALKILQFLPYLGTWYMVFQGILPHVINRLCILQMVKVRKMLTEILLDVTNTEIEAVCKEVYYKEKNKQAKGTGLKTNFCFCCKILEVTFATNNPVIWDIYCREVKQTNYTNTNHKFCLGMKFCYEYVCCLSRQMHSLSVDLFQILTIPVVLLNFLVLAHLKLGCSRETFKELSHSPTDRSINSQEIIQAPWCCTEETYGIGADDNLAICTIIWIYYIRITLLKY